MNKLVLLACLLASSLAQAENNGFSLGLVMPYGGLGAKFSIGNDSTKYFGGVGYLIDQDDGMPSDKHSGTASFVIGFDHAIVNEYHTIGAAIGTISHRKYYFGDYNTVGLAANYTYHFSGFNQKSWMLGASLYGGKQNVPAYYRGGMTYGIGLTAGYNF
ncbi:hypothetical protein [Undibacterium sp. Ren11W]|uniref:hypothetical protein n=1 Tax=Undibacterium sp. Ren11W TaxID=3413045 RepID=UPI003BF34CDF